MKYFFLSIKKMQSRSYDGSGAIPSRKFENNEEFR